MYKDHLVSVHSCIIPPIFTSERLSTDRHMWNSLFRYLFCPGINFRWGIMIRIHMVTSIYNWLLTSYRATIDLKIFKRCFRWTSKARDTFSLIKLVLFLISLLFDWLRVITRWLLNEGSSTNSTQSVREKYDIYGTVHLLYIHFVERALPPSGILNVENSLKLKIVKTHYLKKCSDSEILLAGIFLYTC